jgi:hypothetical protein
MRAEMRFNHYISAILIFFNICTMFVSTEAIAAPTLNFSDIDSGPKTGNTDGAGGLTSSQHGAIVTLWGNYQGSQVDVYFTDSQGTSRKAAHIYYEKRADGKLPGSPADLYTYHLMREVAFSIPATSADGPGQIGITVDGVSSVNTLPFTVRPGRIFFIKPGGNDAKGNGSWSAPWATIASIVAGGNGKILAGDIIYVTDSSVTNASINIGVNGGLAGTTANPFSLIAYPNSTASISGKVGDINNIHIFRNWNAANYYWNFSKFNITAGEVVFSLIQGSRIVGNKIAGPQVQGIGMAGYIGGNCSGQSSGAQCGGQKIYGNEVYNYGKADGTTSKFHHLYYISNRSGYPAEAYEIAWNYHHDNPVSHGIHIYDQTPCGGWTGTMKIHHNVVKNQGSNSININPNCTQSTSFEVHDNLVITEPSYVGVGIGRPGAAFRLETAGSTIKVFYNTVYGYGAANIFSNASTIEFRNNIVVDTRNIAYASLDMGSPAIGSNNLFFSTANSALALPPWASNSLNKDPLFIDAARGNFSLRLDSPARKAGIFTALSNPSYGLHGETRNKDSTTIGAINQPQPPHAK